MISGKERWRLGRIGTITVASLAAILCSGSWADGITERPAIAPAPGEDPALASVAPRELSAFRQAAADGYNETTADAALALVDAARRHWSLSAAQRPSEKRVEAEEAHISAWRKAIQVWKKSTSETGRAKIITAWNSWLRVGPEAGGQLEALSQEWSPAFVTESFTRLFMATDDPMTVHAFCDVLGQYGGDTEERLLKEKLASISGRSDADQDNVDNIQWALEKIGFGRKGYPGRTGPASFTSRHNDALNAVAPEEYALFMAADAKGADARTAEAVVNLVSAVKRVLVAYDGGAPRTETNWRAHLAYMVAWEKAIQTWKKTADAAAKATIVAAWNSGLVESREVKYQIDSLRTECPPAFVTDSFRKLFMATNDLRTLGSFVVVLGPHGQDAQERLLKEKLASVTGKGHTDKGTLDIIDAINAGLGQIAYWRERDTTRKGSPPVSHE